MTAVADLHLSSYLQCYYLLVIEGLPYAFAPTTSPHIGSTTYVTDRTIIGGLEVPRRLKVSVDPREGLMEPSTTRFKVLDIDQSTLVSLFRSSFEIPGDDGDQLFDCVRSTEDPVEATVEVGNGNDTVNPASKHIGIEWIDSSRVRRSRWIAPSDKPGPVDHKVFGDIDTGLPPVFISSSPYTFAGRKVALYRIVYDHHTSTWPSWADQYAGGSLIWHGTLQDTGDVDVRTWSFACSGPDSWLKKMLNQDAPRRLGTLDGGITLSDGSNDTPDETQVAISLSRAIWQATDGWFAPDAYAASEAAFDAGDALTAGEVTAASVAGELNTLVDGYLTAGAGYKGAEDKRVASVAPDGSFILIGIEDHPFATYHIGRLHICLHEKAWLAMGWDPYAQDDLCGDPDEDGTKYGYDGDARAVQGSFITGFVMWSDLGTSHPKPDADLDKGTSKYPAMYFTTVSEHATDASMWANLGNPRLFRRFYDGDPVYLDRDGQTFTVTPKGDNVWLEGQNLGCGPFNIMGANEVNATATDRSRYFALVGQIRRDGGEQEDYAQIIRAEWCHDADLFDRELNLLAANGSLGYCVGKWQDPQLFGVAHRSVTSEGAWVALANTIDVLPLACWGGYLGNMNRPGHRHNVFTSLLLGSGTAGDQGSGYIPASVGVNAPTGMDDYPEQVYGNDREIQDLSLNIPDVFVDWESARREAEALPSGIDGALNRWIYAHHGPVSSTEILSSLCQGAGWAISWRRNGTKVHQYGLFSPFDEMSPDDADLTITDSDLAGDAATPASWWPKQSLRWEAPIDRFVVNYRWDAIQGGCVSEGHFESLDRSRASRAGRQVYEIEDRGLYSIDIYKATGEPQDASLNWEYDFRERFQRQIAEWYERRNFPLKIKISGPKAHLVGLGDVILYTDATRPASPFGEYGLTNALGRVIEIEWETDSRAALVTMIVQAKPIDTFRVWAPVGRPWGYDGTISTPTTLFLDGPWAGNWMGHDSDTATDTDGFVKPDWMSGSGDAKIYVYQSEDGVTWPSGYTCSGTVTARDSTLHTLTVTSWSGTLRRDMHKYVVLRPIGDQSDTWTPAHYSVVTDEDGEIGGGDKGWPLT